jgi:branched-subunit amino acid transport protein
VTIDVWVLIAGCVAATVLVKAAGPVLLGGRELPPAVLRIIACLAPALLAALVATSAFADGQTYHVGAEALGMAAGGVLVWRGRSLVLAVLTAMVVTAALRALF